MRDMTRGSIPRHLLSYALPMIAGNIMQLTYNAADSVIIGKHLGKEALAAISTSNPIMTVMVLGASGMGIGASVLMSRFHGAHDEEKLKKEFSTTLFFGFFFSLLVFAVGFLLTENILSWIHVPAASREMAVTYLRIIFVGFLFTFQYNILSNALRAIGDSKTPVLFLGISCALNICLDLLLVCVLEWGVAGAGLATTVSEAISVGLCALWIYRRVPVLKLTRNDLRMDRSLLGDTLRLGGMSALQQTAQPVGKVLIQSVVNAQGIVAVDAFNAVCRVDDFACIPAQSIGSGIMTCTAQNRGAGQKDRVVRSIRDGLLVGLCYFPIICILTLLLKTPVARLMAPSPTPASQITDQANADEIITGDDIELIVQESVLYLSVKAFFFIMPCILNAMQGFFRGMGRMTVVLIGTLIQISIRTFCVYMWVPRMGITGEAWGCLAGWSVQLLFTGTCLLMAVKREREGKMQAQNG